MEAVCDFREGLKQEQVALRGLCTVVSDSGCQSRHGAIRTNNEASPDLIMSSFASVILQLSPPQLGQFMAKSITSFRSRKWNHFRTAGESHQSRLITIGK